MLEDTKWRVSTRSAASAGMKRNCTTCSWLISSCESHKSIPVTLALTLASLMDSVGHICCIVVAFEVFSRHSL